MIAKHKTFQFVTFFNSSKLGIDLSDNWAILAFIREYL